MTGRPESITEIEEWTALLARAPDAELRREALTLADQLLDMGETILEAWLTAHDQVPTDREVEGFRLLALHRQAARGNPTFNACRETCREIVYLRNCLRANPEADDVGQTLKLLSMVVRHLSLFVGGKLEVAGLGDFCCSSRPLRQAELLDPHSEPV
jgi:hypothetical protein